MLVDNPAPTLYLDVSRLSIRQKSFYPRDEGWWIRLRRKESRLHLGSRSRSIRTLRDGSVYGLIAIFHWRNIVISWLKSYRAEARVRWLIRSVFGVFSPPLISENLKECGLRVGAHNFLLGFYSSIPFYPRSHFPRAHRTNQKNKTKNKLFHVQMKKSGWVERSWREMERTGYIDAHCRNKVVCHIARPGRVSF
jgi:hypothetical protein